MRLTNLTNPGPGLADFWHEFRRPNPYRWPILAVSALITFVLMYAFTQERVYVPPERPKVTYITSFAPGRTDAEIRASNIENQKRKDATAAQRAEIEEQKRELYRSLGRATGMDVDRIERQAAAERAEEKAAEAKRLEGLIGTAPSADAAQR